MIAKIKISKSKNLAEMEVDALTPPARIFAIFLLLFDDDSSRAKINSTNLLKITVKTI